MPTKTVTITHEPWCADHDDDLSTDTTTCTTKPIDLSDRLSVWARQREGQLEPVVQLDNGAGVELSPDSSGQPCRVHP